MDGFGMVMITITLSRHFCGSPQDAGHCVGACVAQGPDLHTAKILRLVKIDILYQVCVFPRDAGHCVGVCLAQGQNLHTNKTLRLRGDASEGAAWSMAAV